MARPVAFLFPGQGSQSVGMGKDLCAQFPAARRLFAEADDVLGVPLAKLCFEGPFETLTLTENTQPALVTVACATVLVLESEFGLTPSWTAGHSLGEFSALVSAGALTFADAIRLVRRRGAAMQRAVAPGVGAMAAILGLELSTVAAVCEEAAAGEVVGPANLNGAGQIVIAGHAGAVSRAVELAKARGAKRAVSLSVSAPFHCTLMEPAARALAEALAAVTFAAPRCPIISNVDARPNLAADRIADLLVQQVCSPVRWEESIQALAALGCQQAIEVGPGRVLTGLVKRIAPTIECLVSDDLAGLRQALGR